jgi:predicted ATP-grasp superfamily ATP-dependent carboligase
VLFPSATNGLLFTYRNYEVLKDRFIIPHLKDNDIVKYMNKEYVANIAKEVGLSVPKSWVLDTTLEEIIIPKDMAYPCFIKPISSEGGLLKQYIKKCESENELIECLSLYKQSKVIALVQEFIDKDYEFLVDGCVLHCNNEVVFPGGFKKHRESPSSHGISLYLKLCKDLKYIDQEKIIHFLNKIEYYGLFDIEFMISKGHAYFVEINYIYGANAYAFSKAGENIPYMWYLDAIGEDTTSLKRKITKEIYVMNEFEDFFYALNGNIGLFRWLRDLFRARAFMIFNLRDMAPFWFTLRELRVIPITIARMPYILKKVIKR